MGSPLSRLKDEIRCQQRDIRKETRQIDRASRTLQEKRNGLAKTCKTYARRGDQRAARTLVKQIVQCDKHMQAYQRAQLNLTELDLQLGTVQSTAHLQATMKKTADVMARASRSAPLPSLVHSVNKYARKIEENELKSELLDDACRSMLEDDVAEDELEQQIMQELQIELELSLPGAPKHISLNPTNPNAATEAVLDFEAGAIHKPVHNGPEAREVYDGVASALQERLDRLGRSRLNNTMPHI